MKIYIKSSKSLELCWSYLHKQKKLKEIYLGDKIF